jgi:ribokinase
MSAGGKGANQAVAAARLGGHVCFVAKTGFDLFGKQSFELFEKEHIDCSCIFRDHFQPSGVALITVDDRGENCIAVAPGANAALNTTDIDAAKEQISEAAFVLTQLEIPVETIAHLATIADHHRVPLMLNPAPAMQLSDDILQRVAIITPNQKEAESLTGIAVTDEFSAAKAAGILRQKGIQTVIVTMGAAGAYVSGPNNSAMIPGYSVNVADTTAAGDVFNGALVVALTEQQLLEEAVRFACRAAAISVTRLGAQASAPTREEVDLFNGGITR